MKIFTIQKVDTNLYIKGFSGQLVFFALYAVIGILLLFVTLYIAIGTFTAVAVCVPGFFHLSGKSTISKVFPIYFNFAKRRQ